MAESTTDTTEKTEDVSKEEVPKTEDKEETKTETTSSSQIKIVSKPDIWKAAQYVQQESGIIAEYTFRQWAVETTEFMSRLARENINYSGITQLEENSEVNKAPNDTGYYKIYESPEAYAKDYANIVKNYKDRDGVKSLETYIIFLKGNGVLPADTNEEEYQEKLLEVSLDGIVVPDVENPVGTKIIEAAKTHLGHPETVVTCCKTATEFVYNAHKDAGIDFDTITGLSGNYSDVEKFYTWAKSSNHFSEDKSCMIAGDVLVGTSKTHVAIYMGDGNIIQKSPAQGKVVITDAAWMVESTEFNGFIRVDSTVSIDTQSSTVIGSSDSRFSVIEGLVSYFGNGSDATGGFTEKQSGKKWTVSINPKGKTPAEPVYPDYITITNNIPGSLYDNKELTNASVTATVQLDDATQQIINIKKLAALSGIDGSVFDTVSEYKKRQIVFDATKHRTAVKSPNGGAPKNPSDPYPVDSKIEELETHFKRIKLDKISLTKPQQADKQLAKYILEVCDAAEKRVVKLENILATITRYLFAMGSRMYINCQYYGGQDRFRKYECIRCLKDDLISDGQVVQIDQCLNCDRYEPVIGQVYDILNETGFNLAFLQDDMQASMMSMDQYVRMTRVDETPSTLTSAQMPVSKLLKKDQDDVLFAEDKGRWGDGQGLKMDWTLVPVEEQQPQINWPQNINDTDDAKRVGSYQFDPANMQGSFGNAVGAVSIGIAAGNMREFFEASYTNLISDPVLKAAFPDSLYQAQANKVAGAAENMRKYDYADALVAAANEAGLDPLFVFAVITRESGGDPKAPNGGLGQVVTDKNSGSMTIPAQLKSMCDVINEKFNSSNWKSYVTKIQAYNSLHPKEVFKNYAGTAYDAAYYQLICEDSEGKKYQSIIRQYVPNTVFSYIAAMKNDELAKTLRSNTIYKEGELALPYGTEHFGKVKFTSPYGPRNISNGSKNHAGWDFSTGTNTPIIAAADGVCVRLGKNEKGYGNFVVLKHSNGLRTLYAHMQKTLVQLNQEVKQGDIVGYEGNSGGDYAIHLHFGVYNKGADRDVSLASSVDPVFYFPQFNGQKGKYLINFLVNK